MSMIAFDTSSCNRTQAKVFVALQQRLLSRLRESAEYNSQSISACTIYAQVLKPRNFTCERLRHSEKSVGLQHTLTSYPFAAFCGYVTGT